MRGREFNSQKTGFKQACTDVWTKKKKKLFSFPEAIKDEVKIKAHNIGVKSKSSWIFHCKAIRLKQQAGGRRRWDVPSTAGQFDWDAVPTNTVSETDWALGGFMFYILPAICFTLYIVGVFGPAQHMGRGGGGTDCSSRTVENDSRRSPSSVWVLRRGKWFNPAPRLEIIFSLK